MTTPHSKTEQLIFRNTYLKHKERLADIRPNRTGTNFHLPPKKPSDKKGELNRKNKQEEIRQENHLLRDKIGNIKGKHAHEVFPLASNTQDLRHMERYQQDSKLNVQSFLDDGQPIKCFIPSQRPSKAQSFVIKQQKPETTSFNQQKRKYLSIAKTKRPGSVNKSSNPLERLRSQTKQYENQVLYRQPQRNQKREVIHKKTKMLSRTDYCLFQLSLLSQRMLITAYIMGKEKYCLTELLSLKKTHEVLKEYWNNYEPLYSKIHLQTNGNQRYVSIKLHLNQDRLQVENKEKNSEDAESEKKNKAKAQHLFIQRNYYTQLKKQQKKEGEDHSKSKHTITQDKLVELMDRLSAPKKQYSRNHSPLQSNSNTIGGTPIGNKVNNDRKQSIQQSKLSIHIDNKQTEERRKKIRQNQKSRQSSQQSIKKSSVSPTKQGEKRYSQSGVTQLKQTDSIIVDKSEKQKKKSVSKEKERSIKSQSVKEEKQKSKQDEIDILDGQDEYQEQFQNPSSISKKPQSTSINPNKNASFTSQKSKDSIKNKKNISKNQSNEYENIYQAQEYQNQEYEPMLESSVTPMTPKPSNVSQVEEKVPQGSKQNKDEDIINQYEDQFQT